MSLRLAICAAAVFIVLAVVIWWSERNKHKSMCVSDCETRCKCWEKE